MSTLPALPMTDLAPTEIAKVQTYIERGLQGINEVTEAKLFRMFELYLNGNTYSQIASMLEVKKVIVMYFSHTNKWYETKAEIISESQEKIKTRVADAKLKNDEFMLLLVQAWQKKISSKLKSYLATGDVAHMEGVDLKEVSQLMKAIDMVNNLDQEGKDKSGKTPPIGLNVGHGVTLERDGDKISITPNPPKEESIGDILQRYADESRKKEKLIAAPTSDIDNITTGENK